MTMNEVNVTASCERLVTVEDAAQRLALTRNQVIHLGRTHQLEMVHMSIRGNHVRIVESSIESYMETLKNPAFA